MEDAIWFYRDIGRPFQTPHRPNSESWAFAPYPINLLTWFTYLLLSRDIVDYLRSANLNKNPVIYLSEPTFDYPRFVIPEPKQLNKAVQVDLDTTFTALVGQFSTALAEDIHSINNIHDSSSMGLPGYLSGFALAFSLQSCLGVISLTVLYHRSNGNRLDSPTVRPRCRCGRLTARRERLALTIHQPGMGVSIYTSKTLKELQNHSVLQGRMPPLSATTCNTRTLFSGNCHVP